MLLCLGMRCCFPIFAQKDPWLLRKWPFRCRFPKIGPLKGQIGPLKGVVWAAQAHRGATGHSPPGQWGAAICLPVARGAPPSHPEPVGFSGWVLLRAVHHPSRRFAQELQDAHDVHQGCRVKAMMEDGTAIHWFGNQFSLVLEPNVLVLKHLRFLNFSKKKCEPWNRQRSSRETSMRTFRTSTWRPREMCPACGLAWAKTISGSSWTDSGLLLGFSLHLIST